MNRGNWADWQEHIRKIESRERELLSKIEKLSRELSVTKKLYAESCQASYDFGSLRAQLAEQRCLLSEAIPMLLDDAPGNPDIPLQKLREILSASAEPSAQKKAPGDGG